MGKRNKKVEATATDEGPVRPHAKRVKLEPDGENIQPFARSSLTRPQPLESELFNDQSADFVLISEDKYVLRVRSYYLLANSPFFRKLEARSKMVSPLSMPTFSCQAIEDVLMLMMRRPLTRCSFRQSTIPRISALISLCRHLQCEFLLDQVTTRLKELLVSPERAFDIFLIAAVALDDPRMCWEALPMAARSLWGPVSGSGGHCTIREGVPNASKLDVTAMPISLYNLLPSKYLVALARAYKLRVDTTAGSEGEWDAVALELYQLLME